MLAKMKAMKNTAIGLGILLLTGCTNLSPDSVAGGNCERKVGYGFTISLPIINDALAFELHADCEDTQENGDS